MHTVYILLAGFFFSQLRPPQPAVYLFVLDVSHNAVETGYLKVFCQSLLDSINAYVQIKSRLHSRGFELILFYSHDI